MHFSAVKMGSLEFCDIIWLRNDSAHTSQSTSQVASSMGSRKEWFWGVSQSLLTHNHTPSVQRRVRTMCYHRNSRAFSGAHDYRQNDSFTTVSVWPRLTLRARQAACRTLRVRLRETRAAADQEWDKMTAPVLPSRLQQNVSETVCHWHLFSFLHVGL